MRVLLIVIFAFINLTVCFAQKTVINGIAPGAELKSITLTTPADLITFRDMPLVSSTVDSTGHFSLTVNLTEIRYAIISIDFHKTELFLEPGKIYDLRIAPMKYDEYTEVNPFIQSQKLAIELAGAGADELNTVIAAFNSVYSGFLMENFNALYRDRNKAILDTFRIKLNQDFGAFKNPYFISYASYKFASLEQLTRYHSQAQLARKYFTEPPVLYNNLEYMDFFNNFFSKYLSASSNILRKLDYRTMLRGPAAYESLMKALATDSVLKPEQLRELVLLKGMMGFYNSPDYNNDEVMAFIKNVGEKSKYSENRVIADNIIYILTRLKPGTQAPEFTLTDRNQKPFSLKSLLGKPVVLNFWTTYCEGCLAEMDLIKPLYDKYREQVHFVSISADKYFIKMLYFINLKKDYIWTFLNTGDQSAVLIDYDVRTYPLFVLIDKEGKIFKYPAGLPGNGLEADLQKLLVR